MVSTPSFCIGTVLICASASRKVCNAPKNEGDSASITSPGSIIVWAKKSIPCEDPEITTKSSSSFMMSAFLTFSSSINCATPSVPPYCRTLLPCSAMISSLISASVSDGNKSGEGFPPANEIMPGTPSRLNILRISLPPTPSKRFANRYIAFAIPSMKIIIRIILYNFRASISRKSARNTAFWKISGSHNLSILHAYSFYSLPDCV